MLATNVRKIDNYSVGIDVLMRYGSDKDSTLFDVRQSYLVLATGDVLLNNDITVSETAKTLARVGMQIPFSTLLDTAEWLGRNIESYVDRRSAGRIRGRSTGHQAGNRQRPDRKRGERSRIPSQVECRCYRSTPHHPRNQVLDNL